MDVGFYLGELLMLQDEVSVPGLGYFVLSRVSGYYNETEGKFYPPYHQAQFDVQSIDDDALAEYIADKKKISVASARYFSEKYITNLKQEALLGEVPIGNLGWFYTELTQLTFRPAEKVMDDTIFYGLEAVKINKAGRGIPPVEDRPKEDAIYMQRPAEPQTTAEEKPEDIASPPPQAVYITPLPDSQVGLEEEFEEEEENKSPLRRVLIIVTVIIVLGVAAFATYRYKPELINKLIFWKKHTVVAPVAVKPEVDEEPVTDSVNVDSAKTDSAKTDSAKKPKDTIAKAPVTTKKVKVITPKAKPEAIKKAEVTPPVIIKKTEVAPPKTTVITKRTDIPVQKAPATVITKTEAPATGKLPTTAPGQPGTSRFEVIAAVCRTEAEAAIAIKKLRAVGLNPKIVADGSGPPIRISVGAYKTQAEAKDVAVRIIEQGKVRTDVYPIEIKTP